VARVVAAVAGAGRRLLARRGGRAAVAAGALLLLAGAGGAIWFATAAPPPTGPSCAGAGVVCSRAMRLAAQTDPDRATSDVSGHPAVPGAVGESYVTTRPVASVSPPPGGRDDCAGRAGWAGEIGAAQADVSPVRLDVSARRQSPVEVLGFAVHVDDSPVDHPGGALLTCTGAARPDSFSHPVHQLPQAQALSRAGAVLLDLTRRTSALIPPRAQVAGGPPVPPTVRVAPGGTASILVAGLAGGCECRWRLEVTLLVDGERQVVTVGRDGARPGPVDDNPGQPPFQTVSSAQLTPYRYLDGQWQAAGLPLGAAQPVCPLLRRDQVDAAFGADSTGRIFQVYAQEGDEVGASSNRAHTVSCAWQADPDRYGLGNLNVTVLRLADGAAARAEFDVQRALLTTEPPLYECSAGAHPAGPAPVAVSGVGDEAVRAPGRIVVLAGDRVARVELCAAPLPDPGEPAPAPTPPVAGVVGDPAVLALVARAALFG